MLELFDFMHANRLFPFVNRLEIFPSKNVLPISELKWMLSHSLHFHCIFSRGNPQAVTEHFFTSIQRSLISLARWHSNRDKLKRTVCFTLARLSFRIQKTIRNKYCFYNNSISKLQLAGRKGSREPSFKLVYIRSRTERCAVRVVIYCLESNKVVHMCNLLTTGEWQI